MKYLKLMGWDGRKGIGRLKIFGVKINDFSNITTQLQYGTIRHRQPHLLSQLQPTQTQHQLHRSLHPRLRSPRPSCCLLGVLAKLTESVDWASFSPQTETNHRNRRIIRLR